GDVDCGVEPERVVGGVQVVVDGLRYPDHPDPLLVQLGGHPEGVLAADGDQSVQAVVLHALDHLLHPALDLERVGPGGAENGAAARQDATHRSDVQGHGQVLQRSLPAVAVAHELVAVFGDPLADHRSDHRVEAWAVTATGEHANSHDWSSLRSRV